MPHPQWLERILSISEGTPYRSILCTPNGQGLSIKGDAVFNLENGRLTFQLFLDNEEPYTAGHEAFAVSQGTDPQLILNILGRDFSYPARIVGTPVPKATEERTTIGGFIDSPHYGSATTPLKNVNIWLRGVPTGWLGNKGWSHYYGVTPEPIRYEQNGEAILPDLRWLSVVGLSGFILETNGWATTIREISANDRPDPEVTVGASHRKVALSMVPSLSPPLLLRSTRCPRCAQFHIPQRSGCVRSMAFLWRWGMSVMTIATTPFRPNG